MVTGILPAEWSGQFTQLRNLTIGAWHLTAVSSTCWLLYPLVRPYGMQLMCAQITATPDTVFPHMWFIPLAHAADTDLEIHQDDVMGLFTASPYASEPEVCGQCTRSRANMLRHPFVDGNEAVPLEVICSKFCPQFEPFGTLSCGC